MSDEAARHDLLDLTTQIVTAHVSHNPVATDALADIIRQVYRTLATLGKEAPAETQPVPAVPVRRSVFQDYIVCLEDGKKLKMLKRHLKAVYNMTPQQYRERWNLPANYPMVAPEYAQRRASLARQIGLGTRPRRAR